VREARGSDVAALVALEERCFPAADRFPRRTWARLVRSPSALTLVIDGDPDVAAAIVGLFRRGSRVARIYSLAVGPEQRGRGLAALLVRALARRAAGRGCDHLSLEVRERNAAALGLYAKLGFAAAGRLPRYYGDGAHGLRLRAPIT
jgi:ribosomal protein S18 acetylase RimI-like enzyme